MEVYSSVIKKSISESETMQRDNELHISCNRSDEESLKIKPSIICSKAGCPNANYAAHLLECSTVIPVYSRPDVIKKKK